MNPNNTVDQTQQMQQIPVEQPPAPVSWSWITQRGETDSKAASIWRLGFLAPDGGEVRVTFHQIIDAQPTQPDPNQQQQQPNDMGMGMMGAPPQGNVIPPGEPNPDSTENSTFYVTFFSNRNPQFFLKWDTSLSHEDSLTVWVTVTHGLIDFIRKAKPANLILDDLANGKLKMVLRSVSMDVVESNPDYQIEHTQKHPYRTLYQIKKKGSPSAFQTDVQGTNAEGQNTETPQQPSPVTPPVQTSDEKGPQQPETPAPANQGTETPVQAPQAPVAPPAIKQTPSKKGLTVEIGRDYSVAVKDQANNPVDRYRGKNPSDIFRWLLKKGYEKSRMKVVDKEVPAGVVAKDRNAENMPPNDPLSNQNQQEQVKAPENFIIEGSTVCVRLPLDAKRAAYMNYEANAKAVRCTADSVIFEFATDKDMNFKRALVELAYQRTASN
jgi:hypothetical protein